MNSASTSATIPPRALALALGLVAFAALMGGAAGLFGAGLAVLVLLALLPFPIILHDFRAGVILLTLLMPIAPMLPQVKGLNPLNFVTAATLVSLFLQQAFAPRRELVGLPAAAWLAIVLPASWGICIAWPHIHEGVHNYPALDDARRIYDPWAYAIARYIKPLFYYLAYVFLLANAVRQTQRPERFALLLAAVVVVPSLAVFYTVATYPGTLQELTHDREFMAARGLHANEFGMMLAAASGPLLFMGGAATTAAWRWVARAAFALTTAALLLTLSRGGMMAWLVVVIGYLWHYRRLKTFVLGTTLALAFLAGAPEAMKERFVTGMHAGAISDVSDVEKDELTAGRVHGWELLAPEVLDSPWFGRGIGSTQWSDAVAAGRYKANHPHNIYLEVLMDLGLVGLGAMAWFYGGCLRRLRRLANSDGRLAAPLRGYFAGARYSLIGVLIMAATTGYYLPNAAQFPIWLSLGMAFAFPDVRASTARRQALARTSGAPLASGARASARRAA
jgi:O-antigen ligase